MTRGSSQFRATQTTCLFLIRALADLFSIHSRAIRIQCLGATWRSQDNIAKINFSYSLDPRPRTELQQQQHAE